MAVLGQAAFQSRAFWWSELYFTAILLLSRMLTGLRVKTETLLAAAFNPLLSAHFWATAGAGTIVLTALSSSVSKGNYIQKWNNSACRQKLRKCCVYEHVHPCTCVWLSLYCLRMALCIWEVIVFESTHIFDCKFSCVKVCWFHRVCPLNTIFTAVSAPLFQPQVSAH